MGLVSVTSCALITPLSPSCGPRSPDRTAYAEALTLGTTIFEHTPRGPGPNDFRALVAEIKELLA